MTESNTTEPGATGTSTSNKVAMVGTITCQDGKADEMAAVLAEMVAAARNEPGVDAYTYLRGEGNEFWFFALMRDAESMQQHGQTPAMKSAMEAFMPLMAEPPQMRVTSPIAAIGLEL
ncbi:MAG: putative quinol monooxygenase [Actinomycetota bacterium]